MDVIHILRLSVLLLCPYMVDYWTKLTTPFSDAWSAAKQHITHAQHKQKQQYNKNAKESPVKLSPYTWNCYGQKHGSL